MKDDTTRVTVRLPSDLVKKIKMIAVKKEITLTKLIKNFIKIGIGHPKL